MLELLLTWCVVEGEEGGCEGVMYHEMIHMLNWKTEVPDSVIATVSQSHTGERDKVLEDTRLHAVILFIPHSKAPGPGSSQESGAASDDCR